MPNPIARHLQSSPIHPGARSRCPYGLPETLGECSPEQLVCIVGLDASTPEGLAQVREAATLLAWLEASNGHSPEAIAADDAAGRRLAMQAAGGTA